MAQVEHADTADKVDVTLAIDIPDLGIAAMIEFDRVNYCDGIADGLRRHDKRRSRGLRVVYGGYLSE
jgi:hypothetical protein